MAALLCSLGLGITSLVLLFLLLKSNQKLGHSKLRIEVLEKTLVIKDEQIKQISNYRAPSSWDDRADRVRDNPDY